MARPRRSAGTSVSYNDTEINSDDGLAPTTQARVAKSRTAGSEDDSDFEETVKEDDDDDEDDAEGEDGQSSVAASDGEKDEEEGEEDAENDEEEEGEELVEVEEKKPKPRAKVKSKGDSNGKLKTRLDQDLPPIISLPDIFKDLVCGKPEKGLAAVVKQLSGRALRVGTMCSGTESPLLALDLISTALFELTGVKLEIQHIFSCEIVPFKQAYIERNFAPPLLFRDIEQLGDDQAFTAYGGLADVPGGLDILVAGTSCIDYSPLNGKKKKIEDKGESGRTFFGMLNYIIKHKTPIVVIENVLGAPWSEVIERFGEAGYDAEWQKMDTKNYYIPHTRTRGYLMAVPKTKSKVPKMFGGAGNGLQGWADYVVSLRRQASVPLEAFLLPTDDPRVHRARIDLAKVKIQKDGSKKAPTDWLKCQSRHYRARDQELLGQQRVLTAWQDGGGPPSLPDGSWNDWAATQTERVLDLMDISVLRMAKEGIDVTFKSALWNLSQNVDRNTGSSSEAFGICPCLTPNMVPYVASRGGPIIGLEALGFQGIPVDQLLLTRESEDQLADLAGNAMSSTAVGAAIIAALVVAGKSLSPKEASTAEEDVVMGDIVIPTPVADRIRGQERLEAAPVDLTSFAPLSPSLLALSQRSARKCICEGREGTASVPIYRCTTCNHSSCANCKAKPEHTYVLEDNERVAPDVFEAEAKSMLPMRFSLAGFGKEALEAKRVEVEKEGVKLDGAFVDTLMELIAEALVGAEFHFQSLKRRQVWTATYRAAHAMVELTLDPNGAHWRLFVDPDPTLPVNDPIRKLLLEPVARLVFAVGTETLIDGEWSLRLPTKLQVETVEVLNVGEKVPTWQSALGLIEHKDDRRSDKVKITSSPDAAAIFDQSIDGTYLLANQCLSYCNSLYRREEAPHIFLFLDASRSGPANTDFTVFATHCSRLEFGATRSPIATMGRWISNAEEGPQSFKVTVASKWSPFAGSKIMRGVTPVEETATLSLPTKALELAGDSSACSFAENVVAARVKFEPHDSKWATEEWRQVDILHEGPALFSELAWVLGRLPELNLLKAWHLLDGETLHQDCATCCPPSPALKWIRKTGGTGNAVVAIEDGVEAGQFEQALKARPSSILIQTRHIDGFFEFRIGLNVATLAHKALGTLPTQASQYFQASVPLVNWRLISATGSKLAFGREGKKTFILPNNRADVENAQPPHFKKFKLRPEQLRSLTWMIAQEKNPTPWVEEEVAEAILPQLGWYAEAKATRNVLVRGGVLADEVGYGKTAITVGLIDSLQASVVLPADLERIPVKATLIVVPGHLMKQWPSEIAKFASEALTVIRINDRNDLKKNTIRNFQDADVVLVSSSVFKAAAYWPQFGDFCGGARAVKFDEKAGRYFRTCVDEALAALPAQLDRLRDASQGSKAVLKNIEQRQEERESSTTQFEMEQSRRLKGAQLKFLQGAGAKKFGKQQAAQAKAEAKAEAKGKKSAKAKKEVVVATDPWKLNSSEAKKDWRNMATPPLSIFAFNRLIVDEFTYLEPLQLAAVRAIRASSRWILSGTPPMRDFAQVKTIANLLDVHLGIDDNSEGSGAEVKKRVDEQTAAESFHAYRNVRSAAWHERRDQVAQLFLDRFARQNLAEIEEIKYDEELVKVVLPAAEMAIYRELEHHLLALDANLTKVVKMKSDKQGDREVRLGQALGESKTPEEALLKRCSHFSLGMDDEMAAIADAPRVCDTILATRTAQYDNCETELRNLVCTCAEMHRKLTRVNFYHPAQGGKPADDKPFLAFLKDIQNVGDTETRAVLKALAATAGCVDGKVGSRPPGAPAVQGMDAFVEAKKKGTSDEEYRLSRIWLLRENCHLLRQLCQELVGRHRSKRYFACVRDVQRGDIPNASNLAILSCCGHIGPVEDVQDAAKRFTCVEQSCKAPVLPSNVVLASALGVEGGSGEFGIKLQTLVDLIDIIPAGDRILIFVQFDELYAKVEEALRSYGIPTASLTGPTKATSQILDEFQDPKSKGKRVLLLKVTDASASGANLTVANWAFFVSPLLASTNEEYKSYETQAIGRLRRFGQLKAVKVYRLLTNATIDVAIFEDRNGKLVNDVPGEMVDSLVAAQELKNFKLKEAIPPTTAKFEREYIKVKKVTEKGEKSGKGKQAKKSKKAKDSDEETSDESSAEDTDDGGKPKKKPGKSMAKAKAKNKATETDDDEDAEPAPAKKAPAKKVAASKNVTEKKTVEKKAPPKNFFDKRVPAKVVEKQAMEIDSDDEVIAAKPKKKASAQVVALDSDNELIVAKKPTPKKRKIVMTDSDDSDAAPVASTSQGPSCKPPKKRKTTVEVVVPPLTPSQRRSLEAHKKADAEGNAEKPTPAASSSEGTPAAGEVSTVATSAVDEMDEDEATLWA